jgi:hypothetical protein
VLFRGTLDPVTHSTLHDVQRHQSGAPQLHRRRETCIVSYEQS